MIQLRVSIILTWLIVSVNRLFKKKEDKIGVENRFAVVIILIVKVTNNRK